MWYLFWLTIAQKYLGWKVLGSQGVTNCSWVCSRVVLNLWSSSMCDHKVTHWISYSSFPACLFAEEGDYCVPTVTAVTCLLEWAGDLESCSPIIFSANTIWSCMCSSPHGAREKVSIPSLSASWLYPLLFTGAIFNGSKESTKPSNDRLMEGTENFDYDREARWWSMWLLLLYSISCCKHHSEAL